MNKHVTKAEVDAAVPECFALGDAQELASACHRAEKALYMLLGAPRYYDAEYYRTRLSAAADAVADLRKVLGNG